MSKTRHFKFSDDLAAEVDVVAMVLGRSASNLVEVALVEYLERVRATPVFVEGAARMRERLDAASTGSAVAEHAEHLAGSSMAAQSLARSRSAAEKGSP